MEVRCGSCNKLFRIPDNKIAATGVKFPCSKCGTTVKITPEEFEQYKLSREASAALASFEPKAPTTASSPPEAGLAPSGSAPAPSATPPPPEFDMSGPAEAAAAMQQEEVPAAPAGDAPSAAAPAPASEAGHMEVRCGSCNKLFRISYDKIAGPGIKFPCTKCGTTVKITSEEFEQYKLSRETSAALASFEAKPAKAAAQPAAAPKEEPRTAPSVPGAEEAKPAAPPAGEVKPSAVPPAPPKAEVKPAPRPVEPVPPAPSVTAKPAASPAQPSGAVKPAAKPAPSVPKPKPVPARPAPEHAAARSKEPSPAVIAASPATASGPNTAKIIAIAVAVIIVLGAAGFFARSLFTGKGQPRQAIPLGGEVTPEGLQVVNATGGIDPARGDLIVSGQVENSTDKPRNAWYVVVDVYDAQGGTLTKVRLLNGKQLYTQRDLDIMAKRGVNIQEFKAKQLQEQGVVIPPRGSVTFEVRILEPPVGIASFNPTLQPFDPVKLYKETAEAQK